MWPAPVLSGSRVYQTYYDKKGFRESVLLAFDLETGVEHWRSTIDHRANVPVVSSDGSINVSSFEGSVIAYAGGIDIEAESVEITEARERRTSTSQQGSKSTVLSATPRNALVDAIKGVQSTVDTAKATSETGNSRAQALGAAATALNAYNTANQVAVLVAKCGEAGDEGGHLIAAALGGAGDRIDIVPQAATLNRGEWRAMEREFMEALKEGKTVSVKIEVGYPSGGGTRPDLFMVTATINGKSIERTFAQ